MTDSEPKRTWVPPALVALLLAALLGGNAWWLARDGLPFGYEVSEHLLYTRYVADDLAAALGSDVRLAALANWIWHRRSDGTRALGVHLAMAGPMLLARGDPVPLVTLLAGGISLIVLARGTYRLTASLSGPWTAAAAASMVLLSPPVWGFGRKFGIDLPLTAAVTWYAARLFVGPGWWTGRGRAIRLGLLGGLLCLVKGQFAVWAVCLVIPTLVSARRGGAETKQLLRSLGWYAGSAAVGSAALWAGSLGDMADAAMVTARMPHTESGAAWLSWEANIEYATGIWVWLGPLIGPAVGIGMLIGLWRRTPRAGLVWGWLLLGMVTWTVGFPVRWMRFMLPAVPAMCILGVLGLARLPDRVRRTALGIALGGAGLVCIVGSVRPLPAWALQPDVLCHPPVASNWHRAIDEAGRQVVSSAADRAPVYVTLEGPEAFHADKYSLVELYLLGRLPRAQVARRSASRSPEDRERYAEIAARAELRVLLRDVGAAPLEPPPRGWYRLGPWPLSREQPGDPDHVAVDLRQDLVVGPRKR